MLGPDVADEGLVDHDGEVAGHLQLVAAADADAVDPRQRGLSDLPEPIVRVLEGAEPLPVLVRLSEVVVAPGLEVGSHAEGPAGSGEDDDPDRVVPGSVLTRVGELAQHPEVEGVQHLRSVERDRRPR